MDDCVESSVNSWINAWHNIPKLYAILAEKQPWGAYKITPLWAIKTPRDLLVTAQSNVDRFSTIFLFQITKETLYKHCKKFHLI